MDLPTGRQLDDASVQWILQHVLKDMDVQIIISNGLSSAAIEASDVVLMSSDLSKLPYALKLAKRTVNTVKANIILSLAVKIGVLILAAVNLAPMWAAILADVGVCIVAVTNSTRLLK